MFILLTVTLKYNMCDSRIFVYILSSKVMKILVKSENLQRGIELSVFSRLRFLVRSMNFKVT